MIEAELLQYFSDISFNFWVISGWCYAAFALWKQKKYVICQFLANLILGTQTMMCLKLAYCCQHRLEIPSEKSIFGVSERNYVKISIQLENIQVENSFNSNVFPEKSSFHCLDTSNATLFFFFVKKEVFFLVMCFCHFFNIWPTIWLPNNFLSKLKNRKKVQQSDEESCFIALATLSLKKSLAMLDHTWGRVCNVILLLFNSN